MVRIFLNRKSNFFAADPTGEKSDRFADLFDRGIPAKLFSDSFTPVDVEILFNPILAGILKGSDSEPFKSYFYSPKMQRAQNLSPLNIFKKTVKFGGLIF